MELMMSHHLHYFYFIIPTTFIIAADLVEKTLQVFNIRFSGHVVVHAIYNEKPNNGKLVRTGNASNHRQVKVIKEMIKSSIR